VGVSFLRFLLACARYFNLVDRCVQTGVARMALATPTIRAFFRSSAAAPSRIIGPRTGKRWTASCSPAIGPRSRCRIRRAALPAPQGRALLDRLVARIAA
jgi:hypothetical protein